MNARLFFLPVFLLTAAVVWGGEPPKIPADPIAKKTNLLFSDDFNRTELGKDWANVVPHFTLDNGALKGEQMRVNTPAKDGKKAIVGHQAVIGTDVPTKDSIVQIKFRFAGAQSLSVEFDDRKYTGSHYGHICMVRVTPKNVILTDQAEGSMRNDIIAMKDPSQRKERAKLLQGRSASFPVTFDADQWNTLVLETVGDEMRASINGKPVAFLKSPGIAHPTKSKIEFGCGGKFGYLDDLRVWNAEPAKP